MKRNHWSVIVQYSCAVLLVISSIIIAFYQVFDIQNVERGTLLYIAQAFLLAGSIFGLEYYITKLNILFNDKKENNTKGN